MEFFLLIRKADEMGINFWLRLLALGLCVSLFLQASYYFFVVNRDSDTFPQVVALNHSMAEKRQTDAVLTARIRSSIMQTKRLYGLGIGLENNDGVITLTGEVPTEIDRELAGKLAQETPGVTEVRNQLQITPSIKRPGENSNNMNAAFNVEELELEANLREKIQAVAELKSQMILLKVQHRAVTITGRVASEQQRQLVEQIIRNSPKVSSLSNQLRIGS